MIDTLRKVKLVFLPALLVIPFSLGPGRAPAAGDEAQSVAMPAYDGEGRLMLPENYREWVPVGSSLGLGYSEGGAPGHEMFHSTLMEPGAYRHFVRTGEFADGSQLVLLLQGTGEGVLPARRGRFASEVLGVEMAVKDVDRFDEGWAYYGFGGRDGIRNAAEAFPERSCHSCHAEHAALDNVFIQFYPLLTEAAGLQSPTVSPSQGESGNGQAQAPAADARPETETAPRLALSGLDPVMLVEGREELGKPEIVEDYKGLRYQFASEPNRARFARDRERWSVRNETCPVVPGAAVDPGIFLVHEGRIYVFATENCRNRFETDPEAFLGGGPGRGPRIL